MLSKEVEQEEHYERVNEDKVVQSGDGDNKFKSGNPESFEVYACCYKVGRVNKETDDDTSSLITQPPTPHHLLTESSPLSIVHPRFDNENCGGNEEEEKANVEDDICGNAIHPEIDDDASYLDEENFSNSNHPDHEKKPHQKPIKNQIVKTIVDDQEYIQCNFPVNDAIEDINDLPYDVD